MKPRQHFQALSHSKYSQQSEHLSSSTTDEFEKLDERKFNPYPTGRTLEPSVEIDEVDEPKNQGLNLRSLWRTIQRNVLLIAGVTTVGVTATTLYSVLISLSPTYEGDFRLLVEPVTVEAKFTDPSVISRDGGVSVNSIDYPTLLQVLQSPELLTKITEQIQSRYPDVSYNLLLKDLEVNRVGKNLSDTTKLIAVYYKSKDPGKVQFVLEELAKGYLNYSLQTRKIHIRGGVQFIEDQLPRLQQQVDVLEKALQLHQQQYKLSAPTSEGTQLSGQLREIQFQKLATQRELQELKTLYKNLHSQLKLAPNQVLAASTLSEDPNYQSLLAELKKTESQIAIESARFNDKTPVILGLREKQKNLSQLLNQESQRIIGRNLSNTPVNSQVMNFQNSTRQALIKQLVDTTNQIQVLETRNRAIVQAESSFNQQVQQFPTVIRQYNDIQRRLEIATKTLNQFLIQRETLQAEAAQKEVPWEIISAPKTQLSASSNHLKKIAMGLIAGFVLGVGAAVYKEKSRDVFYSPEDLEEGIQLPLLGVTPFNESATQFSGLSAVAGAIEEPKAKHSDVSLFVEAFNSLYASIRFLASTPQLHSLVVSSAAPGDGKTTVALHLAQVAALMGQRVLLVDANLRLPQLHTRLGLSNQQGLSNLLSQNLEPNDLIQQVPLQNNLFVLTSGQLLPDSTRLLASTQMQHLIKQFKTDFDLVIYDTPHLFGLTDTNYLAAHTDGILMVVSIGKTHRSAVKQVLNRLNTWNLPILGVVANHIEENTNSSNSEDNRYYEQNYQPHHVFENKPKTLKTSLLTSVQETDDALR